MNCSSRLLTSHHLPSPSLSFPYLSLLSSFSLFSTPFLSSSRLSSSSRSPFLPPISVPSSFLFSRPLPSSLLFSSPISASLYLPFSIPLLLYLFSCLPSSFSPFSSLPFPPQTLKFGIGLYGHPADSATTPDSRCLRFRGTAGLRKFTHHLLGLVTMQINQEQRIRLFKQSFLDHVWHLGPLCNDNMQQYTPCPEKGCHSACASNFATC